MSSEDISIRVANLGKCYQIYERPQDRLKQSLVPRLRRMLGQPAPDYFREFWALRDVSFEVRKGETVGIIGRNGSGSLPSCRSSVGPCRRRPGQWRRQGA